MSTAAFTPRFGDGDHASVEALLERINRLTHERQQLRSTATASDELERNRLEIVQLQWELSRALIARYAAPSAQPSAA